MEHDNSTDSLNNTGSFGQEETTNPTYTTGNENLFNQPQGAPNQSMYGDPNMQGNPNMYNNPNMQGGPNMYYNPNMQGGPNMYGNPNMQGGQAPNYVYTGYPSRSNGYGTASLVFGIISLFSSLCYGIFGVVFGIVAIVLAYISKSKQKQTTGKMPGTALAGLITGILGFLVGCAIIGLMCYIIAHLDDPNSMWSGYLKDILDSASY